MQNQNINEMINEKLGMGNENAFLTPHSSFLIKSRGIFYGYSDICRETGRYSL